MIKKVFAVAVLAMSMAMVSCGGDKTEAADSTNVENNQVEAVTGNADADAFIAKIKACTTPEELQALAAQVGQFKNDPAVLQAVMEAGQAKETELLGGAQEEVLGQAEVVEVEGVEPAATEGLQEAAQNVVDAAKDKANAVVADAKDKAAAAVDAAKDKAAQTVNDAQAKAAKALGL